MLCSRQGAKTVCVAIAREIEEGGGKAHALTLDLADPESFKDQLKSLPEEFAAIDVLVNNAGITDDGLLARMNLDKWRRVIDINLTGTFALTREVTRAMMKRRYGRVVIVSSVVGLMGNPGQANYAASKAGLIGFSKSVARELGSRGITCNVVAPGYVTTDMTADLSEETSTALASQIALGRLGAPEDIAAAVLFLASREAGYSHRRSPQRERGLVHLRCHRSLPRDFGGYSWFSAQTCKISVPFQHPCAA